MFSSLLTVPLLLTIVTGGIAENFNITSPPVTDWGTWGQFQKCPLGTRAQGFQLLTQRFQGPLTDDTALNGVRLYCGDPFNQSTHAITSKIGDFGNWGSTYSCFPGNINGFQLRVEPYLGSGDDTATNNMRVFCSGDPNNYVEGDGLGFGLWGESRRCFSDQGVCGLQTQVEDCNTTGKSTVSIVYMLFK